MADRMRQIAQRLKDKVHLNQLNLLGKDKVDQLLAKYAPAEKVTDLAEKFKEKTIGKRVKELVTKYEKFTGVEEIMALQNTVVAAQDRFIASQERRREVGRQVTNIDARLKELHAEMQNTMKGDEKYLKLCTEEHKLIIEERALRLLFSDAEREERELFATMSAAVKLGHERERAHAERNKYWYIVASILGTLLGIAGSTVNNQMKMAELRDLMDRQMARSASVLYTMAGGDSASRADITDAMKSEIAHQEQLAHNLKIMQDNINHLASKQSSLIEHLNRHEHNISNQLRDVKRAIIIASQASAKGDEEITKVLSKVHYNLDEETTHHLDTTNQNPMLFGIGVVVCAALLFGFILGR